MTIRKLTPHDARCLMGGGVFGSLAIAPFALALAVLYGAWGEYIVAAALVAAAVFLAYGMRVSRGNEARKPDYARIASLEREIYGEAFRHDGAPRTGGGIWVDGTADITFTNCRFGTLTSPADDSH